MAETGDTRLPTRVIPAGASDTTRWPSKGKTEVGPSTALAGGTSE